MNILNDVEKEVRDKREQALEKMFAMFGFTKDYLINRNDEFMVTEYADKQIVRRYSHNGKALFDEITKFEDGKIKMEYVPLI